MLVDVVTMLWKEWKELLQFQGGERAGVKGLLIMVGVFGIFMPLQAGPVWVESAVSLGLWVTIPLLLVSTLVADSFAGERERHTLETLLASRLPDLAILAGKIGAVVSYAWLVTQVVFVVALVPVNILHGKGKLLVYTPVVAVSGLVLSFLLACLMSNIGILVSLRAETVKQAQQKLGLSVFIGVYLVPMAGVYALRWVPQGLRDRLFQPILTGDVGGLVLLACAGLMLMNVGMFVLARVRFQRTRLVCDQ
jgi:ABC-2 type transport system permease protein